MSDPISERFLEKLRVSVEEGSFVKVTLSQPAERGSDLRNLYGRPVQLKDGLKISLVWHYATRDVTKNLAAAEAEETLRSMLGSHFERAHLFTLTGDWQLRLGHDGAGALKASRPAIQKLPAPEHDRSKARPLAPESPFLRALGVTNSLGEARPGMADKLRQIERFTELLGHLLADSSLRDQPAVRAVDMGAGKGYLTFATYEFFRAKSVAIDLTGVELREDLVKFGNQTAATAGFAGLKFVQGAIGEFPHEPLDVLIALHACDTATDDALFAGIRAGASLILVAPCCHKEVRRQMEPPELLRDLTKHGILLERQAEIVTDALRALLLEMHGYKTSVLEFIAPEHTGKNLMIAAQRRTHPMDPAPLRSRCRELMAFFGLREQHLARLLGEL